MDYRVKERAGVKSPFEGGKGDVFDSKGVSSWGKKDKRQSTFAKATVDKESKKIKDHEKKIGN